MSCTKPKGDEDDSEWEEKKKKTKKVKWSKSRHNSGQQAEQTSISTELTDDTNESASIADSDAQTTSVPQSDAATSPIADSATQTTPAVADHDGGRRPSIALAYVPTSSMADPLTSPEAYTPRFSIAESFTPRLALTQAHAATPSVSDAAFAGPSTVERHVSFSRAQKSSMADGGEGEDEEEEDEEEEEKEEGEAEESDEREEAMKKSLTTSRQMTLLSFEALQMQRDAEYYTTSFDRRKVEWSAEDLDDEEEATTTDDQETPLHVPHIYGQPRSIVVRRKKKRRHSEAK